MPLLLGNMPVKQQMRFLACWTQPCSNANQILFCYTYLYKLFWKLLTEGNKFPEPRESLVTTTIVSVNSSKFLEC
jgi:hypothetical protein